MSEKIYIFAGRPASIVDTIDVPFSARNAALRTTVEFVQFVTDTSQRLRRAVEAGEP